MWCVEFSSGVKAAMERALCVAPAAGAGDAKASPVFSPEQAPSGAGFPDEEKRQSSYRVSEVRDAAGF
jgi:hypothetical protein